MTETDLEACVSIYYFSLSFLQNAKDKLSFRLLTSYATMLACGGSVAVLHKFCEGMLNSGRKPVNRQLYSQRGSEPKF